MQFAVRVEKIDPPELDDVFAAIALGVTAMLDDHRSLPEGPWHEPVTTWNGARIRKIVRRARGAAWGRAQIVPGLTVRRGSASVRAFVPGPIDDAPPELSKLQIQSTPLPTPAASLDPNVDPATLLVALNPAVEMSWGKRGAGRSRSPSGMGGDDSFATLDWNAAGRPSRADHHERALGSLLPHAAVTIRDGGFTEVAPEH